MEASGPRRSLALLLHCNPSSACPSRRAFYSLTYIHIYNPFVLCIPTFFVHPSTPFTTASLHYYYGRGAGGSGVLYGKRDGLVVFGATISSWYPKGGRGRIPQKWKPGCMKHIPIILFDLFFGIRRDSKEWLPGGGAGRRRLSLAHELSMIKGWLKTGTAGDNT